MADRITGQAIFTRFHGPGNVKGSRYSATASMGERIVLATDFALNSEENHIRAARALADKLAWKGALIGGGTRDQRGYAFTFDRE